MAQKIKYNLTPITQEQHKAVCTFRRTWPSGESEPVVKYRDGRRLKFSHLGQHRAGFVAHLTSLGLQEDVHYHWIITQTGDFFGKNAYESCIMYV